MNTYYQTCTEISAIENKEYSGYLWLSDQSEPEYIDGLIEFAQFKQNPFIVEGNLLAKDGTSSVSIKHIGTGYIITVFNLQEIEPLPESVKTRIEYIIHKQKGKICFVQIWEPEDDKLCVGMKVLRPTFQYFNGIKHKKEEI